MEVYSTNQQSNTWGAAFNKPLILLTPQEGAALLERKMQQKSMGNMTLQENNSTLVTNNSYRNQNTIYEVLGKDNSSTFLDFRFLMRDETSCLKGSLSDAGDVDFYNFSIPYNRTLQNQFAIEIKMEMPEGSNYRMTLYDEYATQIQGVNRYLNAASGGNIALEDLYLRADSRVGGLPEKVEKLLYEKKNNIKTENIRDMLTDIVQNISKSGNAGIPEFSSEFQFQDGMLFVVDGGFSVDMDMLSEYMTYKTADKYDYYKYRFDRVL